MAITRAQPFLLPWFLLVLTFLFRCSNGGRTLTALMEDQTYTMTYHDGALLTGPISVDLIFYGKFTSAQRAIISDFISSLSSESNVEEPSVFSWWKTLEKYYLQSKKPFPSVRLGSIHDESYSLGNSVQNDDLDKLAARGGGDVNVVLTSADVTVDGFCMSRCGMHGASTAFGGEGRRFTYIWVGNSVTQCPGQCAWPFSRPIYGPQTPPLVAPNDDVGVDGMVINLASMLAGTVTDPYKDGFFQGPKEALLEAATACPGVYGKGAYPGYAGVLLEDKATGASYNANGANGRKYLVPALFDPSTSTCATLV